MRDEVPCDFPAGYDGAAILKRLARVLDPELDEPILDLGFVRSLQLRSGHAEVALRLPTSWCAVNFAYLMAEDVRDALLSIEGIGRVTVRLGDHCAAAEIEAAVNEGRPFAEAFPDEAAGSRFAFCGSARCRSRTTRWSSAGPAVRRSRSDRPRSCVAIRSAGPSSPSTAAQLHR